MIDWRKLNKCKCCSMRPMHFIGKQGLTEKIAHIVACINPDCQNQPSTVPTNTQEKAIDQWNTGMVSTSLFADARGRK